MERLCDWGEPRAREVRLLFDNVRAAPAVLTSLRDTRVGRIVPQALRRRRGGEDGREVGGRGGRAGPALRMVPFLCLSFVLMQLSGRFFRWSFFLSFLC